MSTLIRATIMLLVLVGAPAVWVYYGPLPKGPQQAVDRLIETARAALGWKAPSRKGADPRPTEPRSSAVSRGNPRSAGSTPDDPLAQQIEPLLGQLRHRGAADYVLEHWGSSGHLYRFRCSLPLARDVAHARQFEAIAGDPRKAVEQVLAEASAWQSARRSTAAFR